MTLTDRLSAAFLGALALILVGFSAALYGMASVYLHRSLDDRLDATIAMLAALVEDDPGGLEWEPDDRRPFIGHDRESDHVRWLVLDGHSVEIDRSQNLTEPAVLSGPNPRRSDLKGRPWRVVERRLTASHPNDQPRGRHKLSGELRLLAGIRLDPVEHTLRNLAVSLVLLSTSLWGVTALVGRRLCRRVLAPLTRMAASARELGTDEPGQRLPVAATGDDMEDLAASFNGLLDRWQEALERQARFTGDASHQLRTPLTALIGQVDVALRRDRPPEDYRRALSRVRDQSERLRRIVEALLFLARADSEAGLPSLETFDLSSWTTDQLARRAEEGGSDQVRWLEPAPTFVQAHPALLAQILDNLLDNARDYGDRISPVEIRLARESGSIALTIADRGPGIDPADLLRIFEPFYRAAEVRRSTPGGVGLGLAVARRIAHSMGGTLDVESRVGVGSRFILRLPEVREPVPIAEVVRAD